MTGAWPYRAVATSIYIYNTRHCLIRPLIRSFDDISLLFLYFRAHVARNHRTAPRRAQLRSGPLAALKTEPRSAEVHRTEERSGTNRLDSRAFFAIRSRIGRDHLFRPGFCKLNRARCPQLCPRQGTKERNEDGERARGANKKFRRVFCRALMRVRTLSERGIMVPARVNPSSLPIRSGATKKDYRAI